jgi:hypothetical protein
MVYAVVLTIIMGLTRQNTGGTWLNDMLSFWPFVLIYVYIDVILGVIILRRLKNFKSWKRDMPFLLNHLGLFLALTIVSAWHFGDSSCVSFCCRCVGGASITRLQPKAQVCIPIILRN